MKKETIRMELSSASVNKAIKDVINWKKRMDKKHLLLVEELAKKGIRVANKAYKEASAASKLKGMDDVDTPVPAVEMRLEASSFTATILISGSEVTFIEFGSGITFNAPAGKPATENAKKFGYTIGGYGTGLGKHKAWHYGSGKISYGTPAADATGLIEREIKDQISNIVKRIYG